jgi:hypothetical protein
MCQPVLQLSYKRIAPVRRCTRIVRQVEDVPGPDLQPGEKGGNPGGAPARDIGGNDVGLDLGPGKRRARDSFDSAYNTALARCSCVTVAT